MFQSFFSATHATDTNLSFANLAGSKIERGRLKGCNLAEASLSQLRFKGGIVFDRCDLTRAELFQTRLEGADLSGCEIAGIRLSDAKTELRGAKIAPEQAIDLVGLLGVRVLGLDD